MLNHPTPVKDETAAAEAAFNGTRARPVCAKNKAGEMVVCCRKTARKNGWEIVGTMFTRVRAPKVAATGA